MRRRWPAAAVCSVQAVLALVLALRACASCGPSNRWAWAGAACYTALAGLVLVPRAAPLAGLIIQGALAVHACLVASMARTGWCAICICAAVLSVVLWLLWRPLDGRAAWRSALDFIPILALAAAVVRPADPARFEAAADAPPDGVVELVVFEDPSCPHCIELAQRLASIRAEHPNLVVRRLPAADFPFVRSVPTMLVRGPGGRRLFEGLPDTATLSAAIRAAER